jgi:hypothetical protein
MFNHSTNVFLPLAEHLFNVGTKANRLATEHFFQRMIRYVDFCLRVLQRLTAGQPLGRF